MYSYRGYRNKLLRFEFCSSSIATYVPLCIFVLTTIPLKATRGLDKVYRVYGGTLLYWNYKNQVLKSRFFCLKGMTKNCFDSAALFKLRCINDPTESDSAVSMTHTHRWAWLSSVNDTAESFSEVSLIQRSYMTPRNLSSLLSWLLGIENRLFKTLFL